MIVIVAVMVTGWWMDVMMVMVIVMVEGTGVSVCDADMVREK